MHDYFDGHSVSHHIGREPITQGLFQQLDLGHTSLEAELKQCYDELLVLSDMTDEVYVVMSNHHEFLWRYLNEGRYVKDLENSRFAFKLASYMAERDLNDPVEHGIRMFGKLPKNIKFLKRNDSLKVRGIELAAHGDKGVGFGYGSMKSKEEDYGKSVTGHGHTAQTWRWTWMVGCQLYLDEHYMRGGPSAWSNSNGIIYVSGAFQHLMIEDGEYRI